LASGPDLFSLLHLVVSPNFHFLMKNIRLQALALIVITVFLFWWRLGHIGLIDPDEPFYAQTVREMVQHDDWTTPLIFGQPQFEKPIFFYWQAMVALKMFGDGQGDEFASRVPSALFATALVFLTWIFGRRLFSPTVGFLAALVLATGMEYVFMARLMLTDISLAFFITAALYGLWMAVHDEAHRDRWVIFQFVMSGLATLTKGPIGVLLPALGGLAFLWWTKTRSPWRGRGLWMGVALWTIIVVPWYTITLVRYGWAFWDEFFVRDNFDRLIIAEHPRNNTPWYYPMILLVGSLPWMPLVLAAVARAWRAARVWRAADEHRSVLFVMCWLVPTLVFLTIAQSKLPSYIFFLFVPLALLMGRTLDAWMRAGWTGPVERWLAVGLAFVQAVALVAATYVKSEYADHRWAALVISVPLAVALVVLLLGRIRCWTWVTVAASLTIVGVAFTGLAPGLEAHTSTKGIAARIAEFRKPGEKIVTVKFMVRAVNYAVVHGNKTPWFSPHPIEVVVGSQGLAEFAAKNGGTVLCIGQEVNWRNLNDSKDLADDALRGRCDLLVQVGDRVIFRVSAPPHVAVN
jgi:4-amino-4-deoxy-L-arabinose transferase-like glycosyltransferase